MRLRSKARPRPGGKTAPLRKRSLPQGLPSPTHPLEDLYEAQGLQQHTNVHLQAKHPGRHQSSLQQPQTPSPGPPAPRLPLLEPVALLHPTPPHQLCHTGGSPIQLPHTGMALPLLPHTGMALPLVMSHWGPSVSN